MEFFSFFLERNWSAEYKKKGKGRGGKYLEKRNIWSTGRGGRKTDEENILIFSLKAKYNIWSAEEENILEKENVTPVTTEDGLSLGKWYIKSSILLGQNPKPCSISISKFEENC